MVTNLKQYILNKSKQFEHHRRSSLDSLLFLASFFLKEPILTQNSKDHFFGVF